jgi:hypothetical protein
VAVYGDDGTHGQLREVERLTADTATEAEHRGRRRQVAAQAERVRRARTAARVSSG